MLILSYFIVGFLDEAKSVLLTDARLMLLLSTHSHDPC